MIVQAWQIILVHTSFAQIITFKIQRPTVYKMHNYVVSYYYVYRWSRIKTGYVHTK